MGFGFQMRVLGFEIRIPDWDPSFRTGFRNGDKWPRIKNQGLKIKEQGLNFKYRVSKTMYQGSRLRDRCTRIKNQKLGTKNQESRLETKD